MCRILLIEDDNSVRATIHQMLAHHGHTVIEANNGKVGLHLFPDADADLVITDLEMPVVGGLEVLRELQTHRPSVKTIAISGGGRDYLDLARMMGAAKVLAKPFSCAVLMAAVNELMLGENAPVVIAARGLGP
jgi:DNA-binding response OmpR family regulator